MPVEINIPSPGESITEVVVGPWHRQPGEWVEKDEIIVEIESDKVTLEIPAPESGVLNVAAEEGAALNVGDVVGSIDPDAPRPEPVTVAAESATATAGTAAPATPASTTPAMADNGDKRSTSVARKIAADRGVDLAGVAGTGPSGRITKSDVLAASDAAPTTATTPTTPTAHTAPTSPTAPPALPASTSGRPIRRERLSKLRQRIAERLVAAQHTAAMMTTFN
jgi:2-oxoglutarate dehydrogenase E2 component (dihydrolipoamide succinyltransferase)